MPTTPAPRRGRPDGASPADPPGTAATSAEAVAAAAGFLTAVSAVRRAARRAVRRTWLTEPLPPAQSELLQLTARTPGLSVAEAAAELRLAPNTVSTLVGKLTDQGLLMRVPSSTDGRSVRLEATAKGHDRMAEWRDLRAELAAHALTRLSSQDRAALTAAIPAMHRLAEQIEAQQNGPASPLPPPGQ